jgi:hypothetical protein
MKNLTLLLLLTIGSISTCFAQSESLASEDHKYVEINISDYDHMNLGPKLSAVSAIRIYSGPMNDRSNSGNMSVNDFISTWLLYQTDVLIINHSEYDNESAVDKAEYDAYNAFVIDGAVPTMSEILTYTKK